VIDNRANMTATQAVSRTNIPNIIVMRGGRGACIPLTAPGFPVPALTSFVGTVQIVGMAANEAKLWRRAVAQEVAASGASESLIILPNGNAFEISYAVNAQFRHLLIYVTRLLYAGTYEPKHYRTRFDVPAFKTVRLTGTRAADGVTRYEKPLLATPEEVRRQQEDPTAR
jgi:hypothetical protein